MKRLILLLASAVSVSATPGPRPANVGDFGDHVFIKGQSTLAMEDNAEAQLRSANASLNATYKRLRQEIDPTGTKLLVKAERGWIAYRDAECDFDADQYRGGSLAEVEYPACLIRLTREHQQELERMVRDYAPH